MTSRAPSRKRWTRFSARVRAEFSDRATASSRQLAVAPPGAGLDADSFFVTEEHYRGSERSLSVVDDISCLAKNALLIPRHAVARDCSHGGSAVESTWIHPFVEALGAPEITNDDV